MITYKRVLSLRCLPAFPERTGDTDLQDEIFGELINLIQLEGGT